MLTATRVSRMININGRRVDLDTGELYLRSQKTQLEPKVLALLRYLHGAENRLVSQQELLDAVWPDTLVAPNALQRCITLLRKHLGDEHKQVLQTFPKQGYRLQLGATSRRRKPLLALAGAGAAAALLLAFAAVSPTDKPALAIEQVTPLTHDPLPEHSGAVYADTLAYITRNGESETLSLKNLLSSETRDLYSARRFYGAPSFSTDGTSLVASEVVLKNGVKCARLRQFDLTTLQNRLLQPCSNAFFHAARWLSAQTLLFVSTSKQGVNTLMMKRTDDNPADAPVALALPADIATMANFATAFGKIYITGSTGAGENRLWTLSLYGERLETVSEVTLPYSAEAASLPMALSRDTLLQSASNRLYVYRDTARPESLALASQDDIRIGGFRYPDRLIATSAYLNQAVRERSWKNGTYNDGEITNSAFKDSDGQYQPGGEAVAFVSERSGKRQLWLRQGGEDRQLTRGTAVISFVWQQDGEAIWYLDEEGLKQVGLAGRLHAYPTDAKLETLYQAGDDGAPWLLASVGDPDRLVRYRPQTAEMTPLYAGEVGWAQALNENVVFLDVERNGRLLVMEGAKVSPLMPFAKTMLQWRYFVRDGLLLFQDKQGQIWQYDHQNKDAEVVGHFDEQTLFATDFKTSPLRMLTEHTGQYRANQVELRLTGL